MGTSSNTKRKRTQRDYTMGFKLQIVMAVVTYKQVQNIYCIQG